MFLFNTYMYTKLQYSQLSKYFVCDLGNVDDLSRVYYYKHYINQILKAITIDNVNVQVDWECITTTSTR